MVYSKTENALDGAATGNEVHDEGDDGKEQEQMDEQARTLEQDETTKPHHDQNDCKYQIHGRPCFLQRESRTEREDCFLL